MFYKRNMFLKTLQNLEDNTCQGLSFKFIKKVGLAQAFSREFWKIFKNTFNRTLLDDSFSWKTVFDLKDILDLKKQT